MFTLRGGRQRLRQPKLTYFIVLDEKDDDMNVRASCTATVRLPVNQYATRHMRHEYTAAYTLALRTAAATSVSPTKTEQLVAQLQMLC